MTTDELNAIVKAVMDELEKAGVDFDFKAETPQPTDLVYVMRGTADKYQGITVKWQNLLDIIVQKATEARDDAISAKDIALQTLATIRGIESNVSSMKFSVETTANDVSMMKASVEASEANVTQMKSEVTEMKTSVEGTKTEVENIKEETAGLIGTKADKTYVDGELAKKVNYTDALTYEEIMATNPVPDLTNKVASASALQVAAQTIGVPDYSKAVLISKSTSVIEQEYTAPSNGILIGSGYGTGQSTSYVTFQITPIIFGEQGNADERVFCLMPVSKGDIVTIRVYLITSNDGIYFIPYK